MGEPGPDADVSLVGRDAEVARALLVLDRARSGTASTLLVAGDAGIGKTALLNRLMAAATEADAVVLRGAGLPLTSLASPFRTLRGLLQHLPTTTEPPPEPPAEAEGGSRLRGGPDPVEFDAWLDDLAADRPVLLAVDDVHWVDTESLDVLRYVIAGDRQRSVGVVMTLRSEEVVEGHPLHRWLADIRRLPGFEQLDLGPLDRNATTELVRAVIGGEPHQTLTDEVHRRSGGNPYLARLLVAGAGPSDTGLPDGAAQGLEDAVLAGWHDLDPGARELTTVLAIAGAALERGELAQLVDGRLDLDRVPEWLAAAVNRAVLDVDDQGRFWFHHPLQAELLESRAYPEDRTAWHEACAMLARSRLGTGDGRARDAARVVAIADHYHAAGMNQEAFDWAVRVAAELDGDASPPDISRALRRAIELLDVLGVTEPTRGDLLWRLRRNTAAAGDLEGEHDAVQALLDDTDAETEPHVAAELLIRRAQLRHFLHVGDLLVEEAEQALELASRRPGTAQHALALAHLARVTGWESRDDAATALAVSLAEQAVAMASASGDPRALAHALAARSRTALAAGDIQTAQDAARAAYIEAVRSGDHLAVVHAISTEFNATGGSESSPALRRLLSRRRDELVARGTPHSWVASVVQDLAGAELEAGNVVAAREALRFILGASPGVHAELLTRLTAARLAVLTGDAVQATQHLARADELDPELPAGRGPGRASATRAEVLLANGDPRAAFGVCVRAMRTDVVDAEKSERLLPLGAAALADLAVAGQPPDPDLDLDVDAESIALERDYPPASSGAAEVSPIPVTGSLTDPAYRAQHHAFDAWYWAELGRARGADDAVVRWVHAAAELDEAELPWDAAYAWMRLAEARLAAEPVDRRAAAAALRAAAERARPLEAAPVLDRVEELAGDARVSLASVRTAPPDAGLDGMTRREREILEHVVAGRTYGEIADALFISEKTVSSHISNMLRKTGAANRRALAELARRTR